MHSCPIIRADTICPFDITVSRDSVPFDSFPIADDIIMESN